MKNKKKFKKELYDLLCAECKMHSGFYPSSYLRKEMKIKIFTDTSRSRLEDKANEFLQNVQDVCYIRFSTAVADDGTKRGLLYYSVMIQYESFQED